MSGLPVFHSKARIEAQDRTKLAQSERDRATSFLEEIDDVLALSDDAR